jgi:NitT/TauT family transport system ATP-binding protein
LGDRIVVVSNRPGRVKEVIPVTIPRPRSGRKIRHLPEYGDIRDRIWELLGGQATSKARPSGAGV